MAGCFANAGHSARVQRIALAVGGTELGPEPRGLDDLRFAALVHDIGENACFASSTAWPRRACVRTEPSTTAPGQMKRAGADERPQEGQPG